ncbi:hypothetical protein BaRGS_00009162 [Batillaria attramentaria]|uniref:Uncharacterized protein n=1 Tax=Batillaria attramentaria TaxID=370345 RepID=A0ABD0LJ79_9CAEN
MPTTASLSWLLLFALTLTFDVAKITAADEVEDGVHQLLSDLAKQVESLLAQQTLGGTPTDQLKSDILSSLLGKRQSSGQNRIQPK